ncbi:hypothetical protein [Sphingomonas azotifigens]|uniref:hypothetical protein n=1 Tax=Sphingomonas azotifigens TaxID=330920 RepID=UPI000A023722|nr:hypothetical protein [Sphingomonas azotifigens]
MLAWGVRMRVFVAFVLLFLSACSYQQAFNQFSTAEEQALALQTVRAVQGDDLKWLSGHADASLRAQLNATILAQMQVLAPKGTPVLGGVNVQWFERDGRRTTFKRFTYEVGGDGKWALIQVLLDTGGEKPLVNGAFVQPLDRSLMAANRLALEGKGGIHYLWLAAMGAALATSVIAFVLVLRTKGLRLKWLWCIGALFSFGVFQLNWTSGGWVFLPISFLLLGAAGFQQGPLQPWVLSFALPFVAIVFLVLRAVGRLPIKPAADQSIGTP